MNSLGLGPSDAQSRWIGVGRHQAVLTMAGIVLCADWLTGHHRPVLELIIGLVVLVCSVRFSTTGTVGELLLTYLRFLVRPGWSELSITRTTEGTVVNADFNSPVAGYQLQHSGRLDLTGEDLDVAASVRELCTALSLASPGAHVSQHVFPTDTGHTTLLCTGLEQPPRGSWIRTDDAIDELLRVAPQVPVPLLERWSYVRAGEDAVRVARVHDFSAAPSGEAVLQSLQRRCPLVIVALHIDIIGAEKAKKLSARAVHQSSSDASVSQSAGFRRTARSDYALQRLRQREREIAAGESLLKVGLYVVLRARNTSELDQLTSEVREHAGASGLVLDWGTGLQRQWFYQSAPHGASS